MPKQLSAELTGSPATKSSGAGVGNDNNYLFREDTEEEGNIMMTKKSRICRK
jgi:hypothetical protein